MISNCETLVQDYEEVDIDGVTPSVLQLSNGLYAEDTKMVVWLHEESGVNVRCEGRKWDDDFILIRLLSGDQDLTQKVKHWKAVAWGVVITLLIIGVTYRSISSGQKFDKRAAAVRSLCMEVADRDFSLRLDPKQGEAIHFGSSAMYVSNTSVMIVWNGRAGMPAVKCSATLVQTTPRITLFEVDGVNMTHKIQQSPHL